MSYLIFLCTCYFFLSRTRMLTFLLGEKKSHSFSFHHKTIFSSNSREGRGVEPATIFCEGSPVQQPRWVGWGLWSPPGVGRGCHSEKAPCLLAATSVWACLFVFFLLGIHVAFIDWIKSVYKTYLKWGSGHWSDWNLSFWNHSMKTTYCLSLLWYHNIRWPIRTVPVTGGIVLFKP